MYLLVHILKQQNDNGELIIDHHLNVSSHSNQVQTKLQLVSSLLLLAQFKLNKNKHLALLVQTDSNVVLHDNRTMTMTSLEATIIHQLTHT